MISGASGRAKGARPLRADAKLNRDRILAAAAELFAERGLSVPLEEIAGRAGVGVATLYRRFPTRADLAAAAFERNMSRYTEAVDRALDNPHAWEGFRALVFELCELQASDAGLRDLLTTAFPASSVVEQRTNETVEKVRLLIGRAQAEGILRPDVAAADIVVMLMANAGVLRTTGSAAPETWRRFAALMVDAFRSRPEAPLPPAPPEQQLRQSIALLTDGR
ncbi:TetR family transcriptional regulator [Mycobacterium kyorinense]|uniref:TetR family transcriptional regulator n=1 Tax=Mycobacterium kyorinense TaxID=487514 RepID=A0A1A2ZF48_9MYCO|nr:TetR/AcrR family transcriptional regulator [Mycobacterium kyorinense]OBI48303.1 TetR family transcriptional regulator [Mycobacterium kyorinense]